jgi:hypothetical protein
LRLKAKALGAPSSEELHEKKCIYHKDATNTTTKTTPNTEIKNTKKKKEKHEVLVTTLVERVKSRGL